MPIALGMLAVFALMVSPLTLLAPQSCCRSRVVVFVLAWIGQFVGHAIEGRKPSFFEDVKFLLIGPAWLLGFVYRRFAFATEAPGRAGRLNGAPRRSVPRRSIVAVLVFASSPLPGAGVIAL